MVTTRILAGLLASTICLADGPNMSGRRISPRPPARPVARGDPATSGETTVSRLPSQDTIPSAGDWKVYVLLAHPVITAKGEIWWVNAGAPPQLMCSRDNQVESFPLEIGKLSHKNLWYLASDTKDRIWVFGEWQPYTSGAAFFDHGVWRTFRTLDNAFRIVAREEKGNLDYRVGDPRHYFYPAFAGDGRVAYRESHLTVYFDGTWWNHREVGYPNGYINAPPFYVNGVLTVRTGKRYHQFREDRWQLVEQGVDCPYAEIPPIEDPRSLAATVELRRRRQQTGPLEDNTGAIWTRPLGTFCRTLDDITVQFTTTGNPLSPQACISEVFVDASSRIWFVVSGEPWLTSPGDRRRLAVFCPKQPPPRIEWVQKPPQLVETGDVSASIRSCNVSSGLIVRYRHVDGLWQEIIPEGALYKIPLNRRANDRYTIEVQAYDGLLRLSNMLVCAFEVRWDYTAEAKSFVGLLNSDDYNEREKAARALVNLGKPVLPILRERLEIADEDERWWTQAILDEIELQP